MLSARFKPWHVALFLGKYAWLTARRRPVLVHFEVTLRCNARCGFCDYWKTDASARASRAQELRRRRAVLQSDARHVHRRRADAAPRSRGSRRRRRPRDLAEVRHADHARRDAHARARAVAVGRRRQPVQHLARLSRRAARRGARHSRPRGAKIFARGSRDARARHRQHPVQHRHQERQPRSDPADRRSARRSWASA